MKADDNKCLWHFRKALDFGSAGMQHGVATVVHCAGITV